MCSCICLILCFGYVAGLWTNFHFLYCIPPSFCMCFAFFLPFELFSWGYMLKIASFINKLCVLQIFHLLPSMYLCISAMICVFQLSHCAWAISAVPQALYIKHKLWCILGLCLADFAYPTVSVFCSDFVCCVRPAVSKLCLVVFHAAAASGSPAVSAPGPGPAHDPPAAGPEPADPPRCHHLLRSLLPLLPAGLPSPAGQGGEVTWRSGQPPRGGRRQVWLDGVPIQLCFYPETWIPRSQSPWPTASPLVSLYLTLANMGFNPITTITAAPATDP